MTDTPKTAPTETKESEAPVEADKSAVAGPAVPPENKPAAEAAATDK